MPGRIILIEGLDLAGKSTLVRNLQVELTRRGIPVRVSRNALCPDNPIAPVADALRRDPGAGLLETGGLFLASHLWDARNFEPPPEEVIHIQDSCWLRTLAYHTFHETPRIPELLSAAVASFPRFDAAVFLTADLVERRRRLEQRESEEPGSNDVNDHLVINDPDSYLGLERVLQRLAAVFAAAMTIPTTCVPESALVQQVLKLALRPGLDVREYMSVEAHS
jgi:thymidylate kinase